MSCEVPVPYCQVKLENIILVKKAPQGKKEKDIAAKLSIPASTFSIIKE